MSRWGGRRTQSGRPSYSPAARLRQLQATTPRTNARHRADAVIRFPLLRRRGTRREEQKILARNPERGKQDAALRTVWGTKLMGFIDWRTLH